MTKRKLRINGHSHLLPYPEEIPDFMKDRGIFWVDKDRKYMLQKDWNRPITDSSFFLNEKLAWMEHFKIDHAVVLNLSQLYGNGLRLEEMKQALRFQNDFNARIQHDNPSKFTCGFVVHPGFVRGACWEIERCVEELGMQLLCLPSPFPGQINTADVINFEINQIKDFQGVTQQGAIICDEDFVSTEFGFPITFSSRLITYGNFTTQIIVQTHFMQGLGNTFISVILATGPTAEFDNLVMDTFLPIHWQLMVISDNVRDSDLDGTPDNQDPAPFNPEIK